VFANQHPVLIPVTYQIKYDYHAKDESVDYSLEGEWMLGVLGDNFNLEKVEIIEGSIIVPPISMSVLHQK